MKKIIIVIVCAGMSVGLLVGGVGNTRSSSFNKAAMLAQNPSTAVACNIAPCTLDEIITNRGFSFSLNGVEANHELTSLQGELYSLKAELSAIETGTKEYYEKISEIHRILGKISVMLGEINSQIDTEIQTLSEISQSNINRIQADQEVREVLYEAETE